MKRYNKSVQNQIPLVKTIRRILIGVIGVVVLAALLNFLLAALRQPFDDDKRPPMISSELRRAAEGVEVFVRKGSELRFSVRARSLRETTTDRNYLEGIDASDFNADGSVRNSIFSNSAVYDPVGKTIDFDGNVRVFLSDGIELRAEALYYDLNTEMGMIPGKMEFLSSSVSGMARDARFYRDEDRLELNGDVDFFLSREKSATVAEQSGGAIHAAAARGVFLSSENRILFSGGVRIESPDMGALYADSAEIELNSDRNKISYMSASGTVVYEMLGSDGTRSCSGDKMVFMTGTGGALEKALILGHANLLVKSAESEQILRSSDIELFLDSETGAISYIHGTDGAAFHNRRAVEETRADGDAIYAAFADTGGRLRNVSLSGGSRFAVTGAGKPANELLADTVEARFGAADEGIESITANGGARWSFDAPNSDAAQSVSAEKLEIRYEGNFPAFGTATGMATLEETNAAAHITKRLSAEWLRFDFFPGSGQIKSLLAERGVNVVYERAASSSENPGIERLQTSGDSLEAFFVLNGGRSSLSRAAQRGNFRFISDGRDAAADSGEYAADNGKLALTGSPEIRDSAGRIKGELIEYDFTADELTASGRVQAVLGARQNGAALFQTGFQTGGGAPPVVVTAEALRYRTAEERFYFSGGVLALTENQQLRAREISIDGGGNMTADGGVLHRIHDAGAGAATAAALVESGKMEYRSGEGLISYSGNVQMKSKELAFSSDTLNAALDNEANELRHVIAEGNVLISHAGRICRGDAAEWLPAALTYVITGNPAMVDDPARGRSTARRLTYVQSEDRIILEP